MNADTSIATMTVEADTPETAAVVAPVPPPYVRVSRALAPECWHLPWSELLRLAEQGVDGVSTCLAPTPHRQNWKRPERANFPEDANDPEKAERRFAEAIATFDAEYGWAFLKQGDPRTWGEDRTLLYQQNW